MLEAALVLELTVGVPSLPRTVLLFIVVEAAGSPRIASLVEPLTAGTAAQGNPESRGCMVGEDERHLVEVCEGGETLCEVSGGVGGKVGNDDCLDHPRDDARPSVWLLVPLTGKSHSEPVNEDWQQRQADPNEERDGFVLFPTG